jgi:hypothetical protein
MDNGNVGPGQMMGQWNNFEAPNYNPEYKNLDPALTKTENSFEQNIEQKVEQFSKNVDRVNESTRDAYGNTAILGNASINAMGFQQQPSVGTVPLGEVVTSETLRTDKKEDVLGTDLPKAKDIDGLEPEFMKAVDSVINIKDPVNKYKNMRKIRDKFLFDRYGRILGQGNG